jgi:ubiquinone/menaquinone biosynthesis C-methylase UbiE
MDQHRYPFSAGTFRRSFCRRICAYLALASLPETSLLKNSSSQRGEKRLWRDALRERISAFPSSFRFLTGRVNFMQMQVERNYWTDAKCAKAFWTQHEIPPYRQLLADTINWANPQSGERWLDLGCGGGAITRALWERTGGRVAEVIGVDCAATNDQPYQRLRETLLPAPGERIQFVCHNFSDGLSLFGDHAFDHVVSGLSISYAESYDAATGRSTTAAYDRVLAEVWRVLRPGGRFVFSVNVPEPSWGKVGLHSLSALYQSRRPLRFLKQSFRMMRYGKWLKQEARLGRFHYLAHQVITAKLRDVGFVEVSHRLSYANQAYIFHAQKSH